jgi:hypothetical protein
LSGVLALAIASPYLIWIATHDFLTIEYFANYAHRLTGVGVAGFWDAIKDQIVVMNPFVCPIWILGLYYFLFNKIGKKFKLLGLTYIFTFVLILLTHAKFYLITPFYFVLLAGGAVFLEGILKINLPGFKAIWVKSLYLVVIILTGLMLAPYMRPVLPPDLAIKYVKFLDKMHLTIKYDAAYILPQWLADSFGWKELTGEVAQIYYSLSPNDRAKTAIFTKNYSQASAIYFYGESLKLPIPISGHDQYFVWGPRNLAVDSNIIFVGYNEKDLPSMRSIFHKVEKVGATYNQYLVHPYEQPIYLGKGLTQPVDVFWLHIKNMSM